MEKESLRLLLAQGESVEQIARRFGRHPSTVSYWMKKHGLEAPLREKHAGKGGIERDELTAMVESSMTIRQIAEATGLSGTAVRHWLKSYGLRTKNRVGPRFGQASTDARLDGRRVVLFECLHHGEAEYVLDGRGHYRCRRCRAERVTRRRRQVKAILVAEAGGACLICGYRRCLGALEFHHLDPSAKLMEVNGDGASVSMERLRAEASKCVLLCSNCHVEVEAGVASVPVR